jgi:phosphoribosylformimino-5-aminoimidazole carboxamide ribonucleotide (ProFAR) isomerase
VIGRLDVAVELSGGIRDDGSLNAALATGCARVNSGTAALERPDWVRAAIARHGERFAVGLVVRGTTLSARSSAGDGGELFDVLARLDADGCARYVVTDVRRDGTLSGPNVDMLREVCAATDRPVIASGGVSSLDDHIYSQAWIGHQVAACSDPVGFRSATGKDPSSLSHPAEQLALEPGARTPSDARTIV